MKLISTIRKFVSNLIRKPLVWWVNLKRIPENPVQELGIDPNKPVFYVLGAPSATNLALLRQQCDMVGLPSPMQPLCNGFNEPSYAFSVGRGWFSKAKQKRHQRRLKKLVEYLMSHPECEVQIVPVALYWGRAPTREASFWRVLFRDVEDASRLRKFFIILFQRRHTFIHFSAPVDLKQVIRPVRSVDTNARVLRRVLRVHFHRQRIAAQGRQVTGKRQLLAPVLASDMVRRAIRREAEVKKIPVAQARKTAIKYFNEIAADYSYTVVRFLDLILTKLWNKIYDGIEVRNIEPVRALATTHEIVYVPCHRSHMDYLLLGYTLYHNGLVPPHIAAGINLNFWPVGGILRRGGAFFIRRSFRGNKLYSAVFHEYLYQLFTRGVPVKFFPEGGRSRTGRLLSPKTGMMAMTVQSAIRGVRRPIALVPVYLGYERLMEGNSYVRELQGAEKQSESVGQLLGVRKALKKAYGRAYVNFGEPLVVTDYLDQHAPDWKKLREAAAQAGQDVTEIKASWLSPLVRQLANEMMLRINEAAVVNGTNFIATTLLSMPRNAVDYPVLTRHLDGLAKLVRALRYHDRNILTEQSPDAMVAESERLGMVRRLCLPLGDIVYADNHEAVLMTYYRNNTLHLFVAGGVVAAALTRCSTITKAMLGQLAETFFPIVSQELFVRGDPAQFATRLQTTADELVALGWLNRTEQGYEIPSDEMINIHLALLAQTVQPMFERLMIVLVLLQKNAGISRGELERRAQLVAQRLSYLYKVNAPEFFDKRLFAALLQILRERQWVVDGDDGGLRASDDIDAQIAMTAKMVRHGMERAIRQSVRALQECDSSCA
ncbi:MAG: glycerol-3-phosphate 1-O-acyltransferase PlsB [Gammaproteobacteria bacterium]|nr:MAG: glycerol-3-phosphate 1-O-acyltransferase PlsB [Gammaproteobacteria bacterium]